MMTVQVTVLDLGAVPDEDLRGALSGGDVTARTRAE
jgi:hypothetical protein